MNPVIALFLANSAVQAATTFSKPAGATPITTLREATQNKPDTDPAESAATASTPAVTCDVDQANRVYLNSQDDTATGAWPLDTCASSCFKSETVNGAAVGTPIPAADVPKWTVNLGGEYLVSHVQILLAQDTTPAQASAGVFTPSALKIADLPAVGVAGPAQPTWANFGATETFSTSTAYGAWDTVTIATPLKGHMLQITAPTIADTASVPSSATLQFCGFKAYGAPSALEVIAAPITAANDKCEEDKEESEEEKAELEDKKATLITQKAIITTEKTILTNEASILTTEKTMLTKEKTEVEAVRDSYINPAEDCGGMRLFGRQFCKLPKEEKEE